MNIKSSLTILNLALLLVSTTVLAAEKMPPAENYHASKYHQHSCHHGKSHLDIPRHAIDACAGKEVGASVEFKGRHQHTIKGTCTLMAIPDHPNMPEKKAPLIPGHE
ncbi:MAG: hypothetical protein HOP04_02640 [Methylophilaceae bacterium]|nr:hypothetical protein [Methylophilaceae bacterium]